MVDAMGTLSMVFVAFVSFHLKFWTVPGMASTRRRSRVPGGWPVALCEHLTLAPPVRPAGFAGSDHDGEGLGWRPAVSGRTVSAVDPPARTGDGAARHPMAAGTEPKPPPSAPCPPRTPRGRLAPGPERRGRGLCPLAAAPSPLSGRTPVRKCHVHLLGLGLCFSSVPSPERRRPGAGRTCRLQRVAPEAARVTSRARSCNCSQLLVLRSYTSPNALEGAQKEPENGKAHLLAGASREQVIAQAGRWVRECSSDPGPAHCSLSDQVVNILGFLATWGSPSSALVA